MSLDNQPLNIFAIMKSDKSAAALRRAAARRGGPTIDIHVLDGGDVSKHAAPADRHDALLLDLEPGNPADADRLGRFVAKDDPSRPVIVTAAKAGIDDVRRFMELGAIDVLSQPIREVDLLAALDHVDRLRLAAATAQAPGGRVVSFLKGGGGAGATTLAVQGGGVLAASGKQDRPRVCLLDLDIQFGNAGLYLDLQSSVGLADLLEAPERMDPSFLASTMTQHESGLDVLTVPARMLPLDAVSPEFAADLVDLARESYDYVLVDLPNSWTAWTYAVLDRSDLIVLVTQLSVASVRQARHQLDTLREQGLAEVPVRHVLNRHRRGGLGGSARRRDAEGGLGHAFDDVVANDYALVSEAINRGVLLAKVSRWSRPGRQVRRMMENVRRTLAAAGAQPGASPAASPGGGRPVPAGLGRMLPALEQPLRSAG